MGCKRPDCKFAHNYLLTKKHLAALAEDAKKSPCMVSLFFLNLIKRSSIDLIPDLWYYDFQEALRGKKCVADCFAGTLYSPLPLYSIANWYLLIYYQIQVILVLGELHVDTEKNVDLVLLECIDLNKSNLSLVVMETERIVRIILVIVILIKEDMNFILSTIHVDFFNLFLALESYHM